MVCDSSYFISWIFISNTIILHIPVKHHSIVHVENTRANFKTFCVVGESLRGGGGEQYTLCHKLHVNLYCYKI